MRLDKVTRHSQQDSRDKFGNGRVKVKGFYHQLDQGKIEQQVGGHHDTVTEHLNPSLEFRFRKYKVFIEGKTDDKGKRRLNDQCSNRCGNHTRTKGQYHIFLVKYIIVDQEIKYNSAEGIGAPGNDIPESMYRDKA